MLFNSYFFIFCFLPVIFFGFYIMGKHSHELASLWVAAASLFFYGWWNVRFVGLLLGSVAFNYAAGYLIGHRGAHQSWWRSITLLSVAIAANLVLLAYFKYANFFSENLNYLAGFALPIGEVFLPLGISFFTFTQIAFLVDTYQGKVKEYNFVHYTMFVTYFPHLIAGPVLHHGEMMPQFGKRNVCHFNWDNVTVGLTIFVLGLAKKVLIADSAADFSSPVFDSVKAGGQPALIEAWIGALAYTLQLYFDFSAYSDMAIGLSLMFNVRLPMNFNSPYKATSIIEFWRRWHMTLSRFLRDYLYIPLGGNRNGRVRRHFNLMTTMLLGGLWHGAGWTFIIWGGLHGFYLIINHAWRRLRLYMGWNDGGRLTRLGAGSLTFLAVVVGWVFFRSENFSTAMNMLHGMAGINGMSLPASWEGDLGHYFAHYNWIVFHSMCPISHLNPGSALIVLCMGFVVVWMMPNVRQVLAAYKPTLEDMAVENIPNMRAGKTAHVLIWKPTLYHALGYSLMLDACLILMYARDKPSPFLYFQF